MKLFGFEINIKIERTLDKVVGVTENDETLPVSISVIPLDRNFDDEKNADKGSLTKEKADFECCFLIPHPSSCRCQTYINKNIHRLIKRFLPVIAPQMSITAYINNILSLHLEDYKDEINKLYIKKMKKPLWRK